jgi:hypothetical protein
MVGYGRMVGDLSLLNATFREKQIVHQLGTPPLPSHLLKQLLPTHQHPSASDSRDGDCLDSSGAICELMFKKPRSLYEVALMSVAGSLFVVVILKAAFAFGFG